MTNGMDMLPPTCCPTGGSGDLVPLLVVVGVLFLAHAAFQWIRKGKGALEMKNMKNVVIVAIVLVAVAAVFTIKNNRSKTPEPEQPATAEVSAPAPTSAEASSPAVLPRLIDLGADKCIPCKMMAPILEDLKTAYAEQLQVDFIDVWKNPDAGDQYGIRVIPTQIFFDAQGKELFRHEGFYAKEDILAKWKELGVALAAPAPQTP